MIFLLIFAGGSAARESASLLSADALLDSYGAVVDNTNRKRSKTHAQRTLHIGNVDDFSHCGILYFLSDDNTAEYVVTKVEKTIEESVEDCANSLLGSEGWGLKPPGI